MIEKYEVVEASARRNECCNVAVCFGRGWASSAIDLLGFEADSDWYTEGTDDPVLGLHQREDSPGNADDAWQREEALDEGENTGSVSPVQKAH